MRVCFIFIFTVAAAVSLAVQGPAWAIDTAAIADIKEGVKLSVPTGVTQGETEDFEVDDVSVYAFGDDRFYRIEEDADEGEEQGVLFLQVASDSLEAYVLDEELDPEDLELRSKPMTEKRLSKLLAKFEKNDKGRFEYDGGVYLYENSDDGSVSEAGEEKEDVSYHLYLHNEDDTLALLIFIDDDDEFEVFRVQFLV